MRKEVELAESTLENAELVTVEAVLPAYSSFSGYAVKRGSVQPGLRRRRGRHDAQTYWRTHHAHAARVAGFLVRSFSGLGPYSCSARFCWVAVVLTQVIENAAVAFILAPVTYEVAQVTGLETLSILVAVAGVVSAGFSTPIAHESSILVMVPGRYEFRDYMLIGGLLAALTWLVATLVTPLGWPV